MTRQSPKRMEVPSCCAAMAQQSYFTKSGVDYGAAAPRFRAIIIASSADSPDVNRSTY